MARKLTRMIRVEYHQFNRMIYRIERKYGPMTLDSRGVYRREFKGRLRVVGADHLGCFLNLNLLEDIYEPID